jgi:RNA polymerase sigma-70 factor (ECF subfamily)
LEITDSDIIRKILNGNINEFRILVERYQKMIFRTCMGFIHNSDDAEDLTQEVFIQAYKSLSKFRQESSFSTWLYRIAVNASLNKVRRNSGNFITRHIGEFFRSDEVKVPDKVAAFEENPESIMIQDEHRAWVQKALDSLPENQRTVIVLSKYDDLSQKEIANIMNTTEGAVEALIQRAKANLRLRLAAGLKKRDK